VVSPHLLSQFRLWGKQQPLHISATYCSPNLFYKNQSSSTTANRRNNLLIILGGSKKDEVAKKLRGRGYFNGILARVGKSRFRESVLAEASCELRVSCWVIGPITRLQRQIHPKSHSSAFLRATSGCELDDILGDSRAHDEARNCASRERGYTPSGMLRTKSVAAPEPAYIS